MLPAEERCPICLEIGLTSFLVRHTLVSFLRNILRNIELSDEDLRVNTAKFPRRHLERTIGAAARFFRPLDGRGSLVIDATNKKTNKSCQKD
jgi:hypothetical protein